MKFKSHVLIDDVPLHLLTVAFAVNCCALDGHGLSDEPPNQLRGRSKCIFQRLLHFAKVQTGLSQYSVSIIWKRFDTNVTNFLLPAASGPFSFHRRCKGPTAAQQFYSPMSLMGQTLPSHSALVRIDVCCSRKRTNRAVLAG